jgi:hypothetical protein
MGGPSVIKKHDSHHGLPRSLVNAPVIPGRNPGATEGYCVATGCLMDQQIAVPCRAHMADNEPSNEP